MKSSVFMLVASALFALTACSDDASQDSVCTHFTDRQVILNKTERTFSAYPVGKMVPFRHSSGYQFNMEVVSDSTYTEGIQRECDPDTLFKHRQIELLADYPHMDVVIDFSARQPGSVVKVSTQSYNYDFLKHTVFEDDSLVIGDYAYTDVKTDCIDWVCPCIYYNNARGLLKFEMCDGSYVAYDEATDRKTSEDKRREGK